MTRRGNGSFLRRLSGPDWRGRVSSAFALVESDPAFRDRVAILADRKDGMPLGGNDAPFQVILHDEKRPARWVRQVVSIEVRIPRCAADSGSNKDHELFWYRYGGTSKVGTSSSVEPRHDFGVEHSIGAFRVFMAFPPIHGWTV